MRRSFVVAACLVALLSASVVYGDAPEKSQAATFSRAEFQFPLLKAFFKDSIEQGDFDRVHMNYISGKPPELVVFDDRGMETVRENVEGKSVVEIRELLQKFGFTERYKDAKAEF